MARSIDFQANNEQEVVNKSGINGIGLFSFTYGVQNVDKKSTDKCVMETPTDVHTDQQITLSPGNTSSTPADTSSTPADTSSTPADTSSIPADTGSTPADNTTTQEVQESYSSPWAWITVAILFILLTLLLFIVSIVLICIIKNKTSRVKEIQKRSTCDVNSKKTCTHKRSKLLHCSTYIKLLCKCTLYFNTSHTKWLTDYLMPYL